MHVHLLRHAEAEDVSSSGRDADRELTDAGRKRMRLVARAIAKLAPGYDAVLVSPYARAVQTAEPVVEACGFRGEVLRTKALLPGADPEAVLAELAELSCRSALLVGHQPHMGRLCGRLLVGRGAFEVPMKKASLAGFETREERPVGFEPRFYLPARILEKLA